MQSQRKHPHTYSFEFFPPNTDEGAEKLALTAAVIAALLIGGYAVWRNSWSVDDNSPALVNDDASEPALPANAAAPATPAPDASGEVVLTAKEGVWLRIYDAADKVLFEKEMTAGERFAVPADANKPMIRTGRADLLTVTIGGKEVAALGPAERTIKDVEISAAALAARPPAPRAAPATANSTVPTP